MNETQKQFIQQFFFENFQSINQAGGSYDLWLVDFFLKTRDEQNIIIVEFLEKKKLANTANKNALESKKLEAETILDQANVIIDGTILAL